MAFIVLKDDAANKFWLTCWRILIDDRDSSPNPREHWFEKLDTGCSQFADYEYRVFLANVDSSAKSLSVMTNHTSRITFGPYVFDHNAYFCKEVVISSLVIDPDEIFIKISLMKP